MKPNSYEANWESQWGTISLAKSIIEQLEKS